MTTEMPGQDDFRQPPEFSALQPIEPEKASPMPKIDYLEEDKVKSIPPRFKTEAAGSGNVPPEDPSFKETMPSTLPEKTGPNELSEAEKAIKESAKKDLISLFESITNLPSDPNKDPYQAKKDTYNQGRAILENLLQKYE